MAAVSYLMKLFKLVFHVPSNLIVHMYNSIEYQKVVMGLKKKKPSL